MDARQAVLLTPAKPSGPTQLLSYKQNASVSPLFATLTNRSQLAENTPTLSPFPATLTASSPITPLFATLTETAGVSHLLFPSWNSSLATHQSLATCQSRLPLYFHILTNSLSSLKFPTPLFSCNYELFQKNTRGGVYSLSLSPILQRVPFSNSARSAPRRFALLVGSSSFCASLQQNAKSRPSLSTACALSCNWEGGGCKTCLAI